MRWAHLSCALWIPEIVIADTEKMEPIANISDIPVHCVLFYQLLDCLRTLRVTCISAAVPGETFSIIVITVFNQLIVENCFGI